MRRYANLIGPQVVNYRTRMGWTQEVLVSKLQLIGYYITRDVVANIESGRSSVKDLLIRALAMVFGISEADLFPHHRPGNKTMSSVDQLTARCRNRSVKNGSLPDDE